jgi:hypothetical protein
MKQLFSGQVHSLLPPTWRAAAVTKYCGHAGGDLRPVRVKTRAKSKVSLYRIDHFMTTLDYPTNLRKKFVSSIRPRQLKTICLSSYLLPAILLDPWSRNCGWVFPLVHFLCVYNFMCQQKAGQSIETLETYCVAN